MKHYLCEVCGDIYDEAKGDPESCIPPGTRIETTPRSGYPRSVGRPGPAFCRLAKPLRVYLNSAAL